MRPHVRIPPHRREPDGGRRRAVRLPAQVDSWALEMTRQGQWEPVAVVTERAERDAFLTHGRRSRWRRWTRLIRHHRS